MPTVRADKDFKCNSCKRPVAQGDEIGFREWKNGPRVFWLPVCIVCYDRSMRDQSPPADTP